MLISSVHFLFVAFIIVLSFVLLLCIIVMLYNFSTYTRSVRTARWLKIIEEKIAETIVFAEEDTPENATFEMLSRRAAFRNLLLEKLVDSEKKFSGVAQERIRTIFDTYGLSQEALQKLGQKKPHLVAKGIRELTVMHVEGAISQITPLLSHPAIQVYQEAQYAMVRFKGFEGLRFLDNFSSRISEWQQLRLLLSISRLPEGGERAIERWLDSPNTSVVIFSFKLIRKFQLLSFYPKIILLFDTAALAVKIKAVRTLVSLENPETVAYLSSIYDQQPEEIRIEILKAIRILKDPSGTLLLKHELLNATGTSIKVNAAQALYALGHQEYMAALLQSEQVSEELIQIVKYALQEKVC